MITPSNIHNIAGSTQITTTILMTDPLDSSVQIDPIISMREYTATPNVAAKKQKPLVKIDLIDA